MSKVNPLISSYFSQRSYSFFLLSVAVLYPLLWILQGYTLQFSDKTLWLSLSVSAVCIISATVFLILKKASGKKGILFPFFVIISINNGILLGLSHFSIYYLSTSFALIIAFEYFFRNHRIQFFSRYVYLSAFFLAVIVANYQVDLIRLLFILSVYTSGIILMYFFFIHKKTDSEYDRSKIEINDLQNVTDTSIVNVDILNNLLEDAIYVFDEQKLCLNLWGKNRFKFLSASDAKGYRITQIMHRWIAEAVREAMDETIKTGDQTSVDFQSPDDKETWYNARFSLLKSAGADMADSYLMTVSDITFKRVSSKVIRENEIQLLEAQTTAKMGNWWSDLETKEGYWSNNLYVILEIDHIPEGRSLLGYYLSLIHPEDIDKAKGFINMLDVSPLKEITHRFITPKGNLKHLKVKCGYPAKNNDGTVKRISGIVQDVTEARVAEKNLKRSRTELIEAQRIAKMASWKWKLKTNEVTYTDEMLHLLEASKESINEKGLLNFVKSLIHPEDRQTVEHFLNKNLFKPGSTIEYRITTSLGKTKHVMAIIGEAIRNDTGEIQTTAGTLQDITDRKKAESDFHRTEKHYKYILETINLAAITLDKKSKITFANQYLANLLGYTRKELMGMIWIDHFVADNDKEIFNNWFATTKIKKEFENVVVCKNGDQRIFSWKNTINRDDFGNFLGITSVGEDITEKRKSNDALLKAKEAAEKSSQFKSEFLSIMSHEIRTPMNAVIGATNLLMMDNPRTDQMDYLTTLKFSGDNLLALINDILDYNKIEAGKLDITFSPFDLHELVNNIRKTFSSRATEKGIDLQLNIGNDVPKKVIGDPLRIGQILNNLLGNATKFTSNGSITIGITSENISPAKSTVIFTVTDTGIGISDHYLKHIFEPFTQASQEIQTNFGGTGLGLTITKKLVELHNGNITVNSKIGKGSTFRFVIPFNLPRISTSLQPAAIPEIIQNTSPIRSLKGMRILIVDDNQLNIIIGAKFLNNWDAEVDQALNGEQAVEKVRKNDYNLIIMDLQMPVMDGFEATKIIKTIKPLIPVLALTADAMPETNEKAREAGMIDYLTKPFVPSVLFAKISMHYKPDAIPEKSF